jgi:hypothetical protein
MLYGKMVVYNMEHQLDNLNLIKFNSKGGELLPLFLWEVKLPNN